MKKIGRLINRLTFGVLLKRPNLSYVRFFRDYVRYRRMARVDFLDLQPCLGEGGDHPIGHIYFYQDTWCAGKVVEAKPPLHVDVGSTALLVGILSKFTKIISVEIRPLDVTLPNLECRTGDSTNLPFPDASIHSLSSICVIEHIGLGRYGDKLDSLGTEKTIKEFQRVLAPNGNLYVSVPIGREDKTYFNAQRNFEVDGFIRRFDECDLKEILYLQGNHMTADVSTINFDHEAIGLFHFGKR